MPTTNENAVTGSPTLVPSSFFIAIRIWLHIVVVVVVVVVFAAMLEHVCNMLLDTIDSASKSDKWENSRSE